MHTRLRPLILTLSVAVALGACSSPSDDAVAPGPDAPAAAATPLASPGVPPGTGKVLETVDAGGYTYALVEFAGTPAWVAGPKVVVKPGDTVSVPAGMAMTDYHSKTLDRTFPVVWFVPEIRTGDAPSSAAVAIAAAHAQAAAAAPAAPAAPVARLDGGQTVEDVVTKRADLAGKDVVVRGRVVKFNAGIMGTNWIHLQDGTGSAGTNDLTVTTDATVQVGDVVVVRGKVATDRDFGSGYKYAVILEKAAVTKE